MKASRLFLAALVAALPSYLLASEIKGLNVLMTSADAQTQMMGMVLSASVLNDQKKAVTITLCGPAANLALKEFTSPNVKKPDGSEANPKTALQGLMKAGASVSVCPLFLPNAGKEASSLIEGISVAKPPMVAAGLTNPEFHTASF